MAKKSQTKARRNNTVVGHQVVNSHNSGSVHTDARVNRSRAVKREFNHCTFNYSGIPHKSSVSDFTDEELRKAMRNKFYSDILPMCQDMDDEVRYEEMAEKEMPEKSFSWKKVSKRISLAAAIGGLVWIAYKSFL